MIKKRTRIAMFATAFMISMLLASPLAQVIYAGNGNPQPGFPHDTLILHIQKTGTGSGDCSGGHSAHIAQTQIKCHAISGFRKRRISH